MPADLGGRFLWASGLAALARRLLTRDGRFVLELHGVGARTFPEIPADVRPALIEADLRAMLTWVGERYRWLDLDGFLTGDDPGVLLTFDDGFANNHDVVIPLLEDVGAPAVFFVAAEHVARRDGWLPWLAERLASHGIRAQDRPAAAPGLWEGMTPEMVARCGSHPLVTVGCHTWSHPRLTGLRDDEVADELRRSRRFLEEVTGQAVDVLAYPFGDADTRVAAIAAAEGFRAGFVEDPVPGIPPALGIPRIGIYDARPWYLAAKLSGLYRRPLWGPVLESAA